MALTHGALGAIAGTPPIGPCPPAACAWAAFCSANRCCTLLLCNRLFTTHVFRHSCAQSKNNNCVSAMGYGEGGGGSCKLSTRAARAHTFSLLRIFRERKLVTHLLKQRSTRPTYIACISRYIMSSRMTCSSFWSFSVRASLPVMPGGATVWPRREQAAEQQKPFGGGSLDVRMQS